MQKGDTALHIALRARSKRITEMLLRNPKNSQLLYKANKGGETPYSIDAYYQKGILTQIFGHSKYTSIYVVIHLKFTTNNFLENVNER